MAKWQQTAPRVLLLHEPTQGVDVGARQQIWSMIRADGSRHHHDLRQLGLRAAGR